MDTLKHHWWVSCGRKYYLRDTEKSPIAWCAELAVPITGVHHDRRYPVDIGGAWEIEGFHFRNKFIALFYKPLDV